MHQPSAHCNILLSDRLREDFLHISKLNANGLNWVIYKDHLQFAANVKGYLKYIEKVTVMLKKPTPPKNLKDN